MTRYENGKAPLSDLVYLGPEFYLPSGTAARWRELQRLAWEKYGVWLVPTEGWNGYRPLAIQYEYRAELGVWAAVPGTSSHGLTFNGRDCAAIDVNNWRALAATESLAWARFVALCRIVGFTVDFVTPRELWHIGDFDPFTVPAFAAIAINPRPVTEEEQIMGVKEEIIDGVAAKLDTRRDTAVVWVGGDAFVVDDAAGTKWNVARGQARVEDAFAFIDWLRARGFTEYKNQAPFVLAGYRDITEEGSVREEVARALREAAAAASVE